VICDSVDIVEVISRDVQFAQSSENRFRVTSSRRINSSSSKHPIQYVIDAIEHYIVNKYVLMRTVYFTC